MLGSDVFSVLSYMDELKAQVRFLLELEVVQTHEPAAQDHHGKRAKERITNSDKKEPWANRPEDTGERGDGDGRVEDHEDKRERRGREGPDVFRDALVGVIEVCPLVETTVG